MQSGESYNPKGLFTGVFIPESMARLPHSVLSAGAKLLFGRLCWHVSDKGECFPSRVTLAEEIGVSEFSARDYLRELEEQSFIRRVRNGPHTNDYEFVWNEVLEGCLRKKDRHPAVDQPKKTDRHSAVDQKEMIDTPLSNDRHSAVPAYKEVRESLREECKEEIQASPDTAQIDYPTAIRILGKLKPNERKAVLNACPLPVAEGEVKSWCRENGLIGESSSSSMRRTHKTEFGRPIYTKSYRSVSTAPTSISVSLALPSCSTIPEFVRQCNNRHFQTIVTNYLKFGMAPKITLRVLEDFWVMRFCSATEEMQQGAADNSTATFENSGAFTKMPINWWDTKPWTASNFMPDKKTASGNSSDEQRARIVARMKKNKEKEKLYAS